MSTDEFRYWLDDCRQGKGMFRAALCEFVSVVIRVIVFGLLSSPVVYVGIYLLVDLEPLEIFLNSGYWGVLFTAVALEIAEGSDFTKPPRTKSS